MGEMKMDLTKILLSSIEKYGKNDGFPIPTIKWSETNMSDIFGEYQYWTNTIVISRLLKSDKISLNALESVVYHEYSHQIYSSEEENEKHLIAKIPHYLDLNEELNCFLDNYDEWTDAKSNDLILKADKETLFCKIPKGNESTEFYSGYLYNFNHHILGHHEAQLSEKKKTYPQVIFVIEHNNQVLVAGWGINVTVYSDDTNIDFAKLKCNLEPVSFQFKCLADNIRLAFPNNAFPIGNKSKMPNLFKKTGACLLSDFSSDDIGIIINTINSFDYFFNTIGLLNSCIDCLSPTSETDYNKLIKLSDKEQSDLRKLWLLNKAVQLNPCFESYYKRAEILEKCTLLDCAANDYRKCLDLSSHNQKSIEKHVEQLVKANILFNET